MAVFECTDTRTGNVRVVEAETPMEAYKQVHQVHPLLHRKLVLGRGQQPVARVGYYANRTLIRVDFADSHRLQIHPAPTGTQEALI